MMDQNTKTAARGESARLMDRRVLAASMVSLAVAVAGTLILYT